MSEPNYSERFTYNLVPIHPSKGTDPQNTHETIRKHGLIEERLLPMTDDIDDYLDKTDITGSLLAKGQYWLSQYDYRHEWLWKSSNHRPANYKHILKDALHTCPIAVSVTAWREENGFYVSDNGGNNHYCLLYRIDDDGSMWVFDSYNHSRKRLHPDHNIRRAKRIWLQKKTRREMRGMIRLLQDVIKRLTMKPTLADVARKYLGTDASPQDNAPDDVGCSESVTTILKSVYPETPIILGTWSLWLYLRDPKNGWVEVTDPQPGTIILSPTGTGTGIGHVGICMENDLIASSNSFGVLKGKFTENYTQQSWNKKYTVGQKMKTFLYRRAV